MCTSNKFLGNLLSILVFVGGVLFGAGSQASDFYTDAGLTSNIIKIDQTTFRPVTARAKVGYVIAPRYAVEANFATNVYRDEKEDVRYEVRNLTSLFLRWGSPVHRKFRGYLAAGYSYVTFDITDSSGNYFKDRKGFSYAIGLEENLDTFKNISFTLEYAGYIDDDAEKFTMSGISAGFRAAIF